MPDKHNWPTVAFGDVVKLNTDRIADPLAEGVERYVGIEHIEPEDLRIRSWGLVAEGTTFTNQFRPGQVLFVKRRAYQRKVALADFEGVCSGDIYVLESKDPDVLLPDLLPFICQTDGFFEHAVGTSAGSLSPRTNWKQLATFEFPLPPLVEQRRVAKSLSALELASNVHLQAIIKGDSFQRAYLHSLFSASVGNTCVGEFSNAKPWKYRLLGDLIQNFRGGSPLKPRDYSSPGHPVLHKGDIWANGFVDVSDRANRYCNFDFANQYWKSAVDNSYLVATLRDLVTSGPAIGLIGMIPDERQYILAQGAYGFRARPDLVMKQYLIWLSNSPWYRQRVRSLAVGSTQIHVRNTDFLSMKVPTPDMEAQRKICARLQQNSNCRSESRSRLAGIRRLKKEVLNQALGS